MQRSHVAPTAIATVNDYERMLDHQLDQDDVSQSSSALHVSSVPGDLFLMYSLSGPHWLRLDYVARRYIKCQIVS